MSTLQEQRRAAVFTSASRVGSYYLLAGVLWILLSDALLAALVPDPDLLSRIQTFKGWAFVTASAVLIWWLVRREVRRVQRSEARLAALADQGIAGMYVIAEGRIVQLNDRLAEIFGFSPEELIGKPAAELVAEEDRARIVGSLRDRLAGVMDVDHNRFRGVRADGSFVELEAFGHAVEWDGSRAVAGLLLDVTDRVTLERKLHQAARLDALGNLTGAVAHDFNNFLTGIIGNLDLMLTDPDSSHELHANLESVRDSAARAAALTGQLLTFTKGRIFHHRPIDPNRHLRKLAHFLESLCQGGQTLALELDPSVPAVILDPVALDQLVVNLFVNAKDAIGPRGRIVVRTGTTAPADAAREVTLEVVDDGAGMPAEVRERIFEPFFTTKERGTGLGLATVRSIVDDVRGHLAVESEAGVGTTIRVSLPASEVVPAEPRHTGAPAGPAPAHGKAGSILVVDNDAAVRKVIAAALRRVGYRVLVAASSHEARRTIEEVRGDLDLLMSDVNLPDLSGPDLVTGILETYPQMRVLFMSGSRGPREGEHAEMLRTLPFLDKPFTLEQLRAAVDGALEGGPDRPGRRSTL